jgi:hypothetical protein
MEQEGESQATADIIAAADTSWTSDNGFGAATTPQSSPHPAIIVGVALVGGFLLARLVRRIRG